jgi:hypothetical protein
MRAEGDLELVAQEQVLDHKVGRIAEKPCQMRRRRLSSSSIVRGLPISPEGVLPSYNPLAGPPRRNLGSD